MSVAIGIAAAWVWYAMVCLLTIDRPESGDRLDGIFAFALLSGFVAVLALSTLIARAAGVR
jgi:hypothetical protein